MQQYDGDDGDHDDDDDDDDDGDHNDWQVSSVLASKLCG